MALLRDGTSTGAWLGLFALSSVVCFFFGSSLIQSTVPHRTPVQRIAAQWPVCSQSFAPHTPSIALPSPEQPQIPPLLCPPLSARLPSVCLDLPVETFPINGIKQCTALGSDFFEYVLCFPDSPLFGMFKYFLFYDSVILYGVARPHLDLFIAYELGFFLLSSCCEQCVNMSVQVISFCTA